MMLSSFPFVLGRLPYFVGGAGGNPLASTQTFIIGVPAKSLPYVFAFFRYSFCAAGS